MTGSLTESMTYTASGKKYSCTTDKLPWSAQRDIQPTQTQSTTPPGNYSASIGLSNTTTPFTFTVAPDGTTIEAFKTDTPDNDLDCSPGNSGYTQEFDIDSLPIPASGTFETKGTQTGTFVGNPAKFTFDFQGHVHGLNSSFQPRLAGSLTESMTYTASGVTYSCTTDKLPWFATGTPLAPTTTVLAPAAGAAPLSGSTFLDASASNATSVQFWLAGGSYHWGTPIATATLSYVGWFYSWDTTKVPNGTYQLLSRALGADGTSAFSQPVKITVKN
jgi:hypothetical protein